MPFSAGLVVSKLPTCPRGFKQVFDTGLLRGSDGVSGLQGPAGPAGPAGPQGPSGADGSIRVYGDGSFGSLTVSASGLLSEPLRQYTDFTVNPNVTLLVPSGTVIRCSGTFTNSGVIQVLSDTSGGVVDSLAAISTIPSLSAPAHGLVASPAASGEYGSNTNLLYGGRGGRAFGGTYIKGLLQLGLFGGGPGGGGLNATGGAGGGTFTVLSAGSLVNSGTITANGSNGSAGAGGGGGGVVVLASKTSVFHSGEIQANGGTGGPSKASAAAGGGGGGGVAHLLAPMVSVAGGSLLNNGGSAGAGSVVVAASLRSGGGGGGAGVGGQGGFGASVSRALDLNAQDGASGGSQGPALLITRTDPTALF